MFVGQGQQPNLPVKRDHKKIKYIKKLKKEMNNAEKKEKKNVMVTLALAGGVLVEACGADVT